HFVHAFAKLGTAPLQFSNAAAILSAAQVIGYTKDKHDSANQREEICEGECNRKIPNDVGRNEIRGQMHDGSDASNSRTNDHLEPTVRILPGEVHDFNGHLRILAFNCILLPRMPSR